MIILYFLFSVNAIIVAFKLGKVVWMADNQILVISSFFYLRLIQTQKLQQILESTKNSEFGEKFLFVQSILNTLIMVEYYLSWSKVQSHTIVIVDSLCKSSC